MQHAHPGAYPLSQPEQHSALGTGLIPEMVTQWPRVVVRETTIVIPPAGDRSQRTVRACIDLGSLLPVDVRVALVPIRDSGPDFAMARQMWSSESYHNGTYLYEVTLPVATLLGGDCAIRVAPARGLPLWRDILRVIQAPIPCKVADIDPRDAEEPYPQLEQVRALSPSP